MRTILYRICSTLLGFMPFCIRKRFAKYVFRLARRPHPDVVDVIKNDITLDGTPNLLSGGTIMSQIMTENGITIVQKNCDLTDKCYDPSPRSAHE